LTGAWAAWEYSPKWLDRQTFDSPAFDLLFPSEKREVRMTHFRRVIIIAGSAVASAAVLLLVPVFC
jgi:hypothetical protein